MVMKFLSDLDILQPEIVRWPVCRKYRTQQSFSKWACTQGGSAGAESPAPFLVGRELAHCKAGVSRVHMAHAGEGAAFSKWATGAQRDSPGSTSQEVTSGSNPGPSVTKGQAVNVGNQPG